MENYTNRKVIEKFKHPPLDSSGFLTDDLAWSDESILRDLFEIRSLVVSELIDNGKSVSDQMIQTLNCVELKETDRNECPCNPASGCYWLKSVLPLPKFIKVLSVTGTSAHEKMERFSYIRWDRAQYISKSRTRAQREGLYWTIKDIGDSPYLYVYGNTFLERISISGLWENPTEVEAFPSCGQRDKNAVCNPLDVDFHTDIKLIDKIIQIAWSKLLPVRQQAPTDIKNNDNTRV